MVSLESTRISTDLIAGAKPTLGQPCTDLGNAGRLIDRYGHVLRYLSAEAMWLVYHEGVWKRDELGVVDQLAAETMRNVRAEMSHPASTINSAYADRCQQHARIRNMLALAATAIAGVSVSPDELDAHPMLLNTPTGVVDLITGSLLPHNPDLLLTQQTTVGYNPQAQCPLWLSTLDRVFAGDSDLIEFFGRAVGYSMTGSVGEQVLLLAWGTGANGKSTTLETVKTILGSYAQQAPADLLVDSGRADSSALHRLKGVRMLMCTETPDGRRLSEEIVKQLTGGDTISARPLYGRYVEFKPVLTPWILTNHRPLVSGSESIWRRLRMIPFTVTIPAEERDPDLPEKLLGEAEGILAWMVAGALNWRRDGLSVPDSVNAATAEYRSEQDTLGQFVDQRLVHTPGRSVELGRVFAEYALWASESGEFQISEKMLRMRLADRGMDFGKDSRTRRSVIKDYALSTAAMPPPPPPDVFGEDILPR